MSRVQQQSLGLIAIAISAMSLLFPAANAAVLTAAYVNESIALKHVPTHTHTEFTGKDGVVVTGLHACARAIARSSAKSATLLGSNAVEAAEVDEWLEALSHSHTQESVLARVEEVLAGRTYLAGYGLSLADIAVFALLQARGGPQASAVATSRWFRTVEEALPVDVLTKYAGGAATAASAPATGAAAAPAAPAAVDRTASTTSSASGGKAAGKSKAAPAPAAAAAAAPAAGGDAAKAAPKEKRPAATEKGAGKGKGNIGGGGDVGSMPTLVGAEKGKVVTRFPPEPSGYLHIGHAKALLLNDYYARAYDGEMLVRFDDTNPSKEKEEFEENILQDLKSLDVKFTRVTHTSDYFDLITEYARTMIREGKAFMDDTDQETMRKEREERKNSKYRDTDPETNMKRFDVMLAGGPEGEPWCLRAKINMQDDNGTMRDPVIFRTNFTPHHRTGTKYKAYPTYDFACPIVDSIEGVTHALRSSEYHDRDFQFYWMLEAMGLRKVIIQDFSRLNFIYTLLSKRKLTKFVNEGVVDGWNDPRFPTVQGMLRRGLTVPALKEFIIEQGASRRIVDMEWDKLWSCNKKHIDPVAPRYTGLVAANIVPFVLSNGPATPEYKAQPLHPKDASIGTKAVLYTSTVLLEQADAALIKEGEEVTLMKWGNAIVRKIVRDAAGVVTRLEGELHLEGDFKKTEKKLTWLPQAAETCPAIFSEFDYLITVPKIEDESDAFFQSIINPVSRLDTRIIGEPGMRTVNAGDIIQLERKFFVRCDRPYISEDRPAIFFVIPDGKVKGMFGLADRVKAAAGATSGAAAAK